jgi:glyoxylase-like metal-dependent hydrolase (beta-lactamase superfamily II)
MSPWFPREPINIEPYLVTLPLNGMIPYIPDWRWIQSNGHTPGHISLFEDRSRTLIVGDAFVTVKQESIYKVFLQQLEISGPPKYFTTDWIAAKKSVSRFEALNPYIAVSGHGLAMEGELLSSSLRRLVTDFDQIALPE